MEPERISNLGRADPKWNRARIARLTSGFPSPAETFAEARLDLHAFVVRHEESTFFLQMEGDAMRESIQPGDILVVDRSLSPKPNAIVVAAVAGEFIVRRYQPDEEHRWLIADNTQFAPIPLERYAGAEIWGVVTFLVRREQT